MGDDLLGNDLVHIPTLRRRRSCWGGEAPQLRAEAPGCGEAASPRAKPLVGPKKSGAAGGQKTGLLIALSI